MSVMRRFFLAFFSLLVLGTLALAQEDKFTDYVVGSAEANSASVTFYLQNVSSCDVGEVQVRVAHNSTYFTTDEKSLFVDLAPEESGTFVMNLSRVTSPDWLWTIDGLTLTEPAEGSDCEATGEVAFERVSFGTPAPLPGGSTDQLMYTIESGDTLLKIAEQFGVTVPELMAANGLTNEALFVGETLTIPPAGGAEMASSSGGFPLHTVARGDTLFKIAEQYKTNVGLIEAANCLRAGSILSVGNQLRIPPLDQNVEALRAQCS